MDTPTAEEILRVKRYECSVAGHRTFTTFNQDENGWPTLLECDRCGARASVVPEPSV